MPDLMMQGGLEDREYAEPEDEQLARRPYQAQENASDMVIIQSRDPPTQRRQEPI